MEQIFTFIKRGILGILFLVMLGYYAESQTVSAPVAHWKFDETAGLAANDASGNAHTGTLNNFSDDNSQWVAGIKGGAIRLDGIDDYLEIPDFDYSGDGFFTVSFWFKPQSEGSEYNYIYSHGGYDLPNSFNIYYTIKDGDDFFRACYRGNTGDSQDKKNFPASPLIDGKWHHCAVSVDYTSLAIIYIDGIKKKGFYITTGTLDPTVNIAIGTSSVTPGTNRFYKGLLDEVRIYDYSLNAEEVATLAADTVSQSASEPVFNWNMEAENVLLDEGTAQKNLTDHGNVTTGGTEPNPPGYGSVGAVFGGRNYTPKQYFTLSNDDYGNRALNGTDRDGTIYVALKPNVKSGDVQYVWSKYDASTNNRQIALSLKFGHPYFLWGYNDGQSYMWEPAPEIPFTYYPTQDFILALSLDAEAKTYTYMALASGEYYTTTEMNLPLTGVYNTGIADMAVGGSGTGTGLFEGTIYWVRIYDEAHSMEKMKSIMGNTTTALRETKASEFELGQNYPNPFSDITTISYVLPKSDRVTIDIFNITGQKVKSLVNNHQQAGSYNVQWDGRDNNGQALTGGLYFYTMKIGQNSPLSKKMLLVK